MNASIKFFIAALLLLSLSACAHPYGHYAPYSNARYYGGPSGYYGNYGGYNNMHHKRYSEYGDNKSYGRSWDNNNRRQPTLSSNQYNGNYYGVAPGYGKHARGRGNSEAHREHHGKGRWNRGDD